MIPQLPYHRPVLTILAAMILAVAPAAAQKEFNVWCFGDSTGLDFNTVGVVPTPLPFTGMRSGEGMASICDRSTGELLFYSEGQSVWNRNHRRMPNGTGLKGGSSSTQAALIVPMPGDPLKYYLFTVEHEGSIHTPDVGVSYSIVDMAAAGGLGDVTTRNVPLIAPAVEKLVAVPHCNRTDFWVITHTPGDNRFHAFLVTEDGVAQAPVISAAGATQREARNWLAASPNGRMLASTFPFGMLELFDFDPCTGEVSNARVLLESHVSYGVCFSPDNSKLYGLHERGAWALVQFDLADNNRRTILDTILPLPPPATSTAGYTAAMQIGPDGKIYCTKLSHGWLGVITSPNVAGLGCGYRDEGLYLNGRRGFWGLPNVITGLYQPPIPYLEVSDTVICAGGCIELSDSIAGNVTGSRWLFPGGTPDEYAGPGPVRVCYDSPGVYPVRLIAENGFGEREIIRNVAVYEVVPSAELSVGSVSGAPGDTVAIPILMRPVAGGSLPGRSFRLRLRFNGTLLFPVGSDSATDVRYDGGECIVTLQGSGTAGGDTLGILRALVGLGNQETTPITLDPAVWLAGCIADQVVVPGEFRLSEICREGGTRLFDGRAVFGLKRAGYDRGSGRVEVRYEVPAGPPVQLDLVDVAGRRVGSAIRENGGDGEQTAYFDAAGLGTGIYFCAIRSGNYFRSVPVYLGEL